MTDWKTSPKALAQFEILIREDPEFAGQVVQARRDEEKKNFVRERMRAFRKARRHRRVVYGGPGDDCNQIRL